jgi:hypothetical protein
MPNPSKMPTPRNNIVVPGKAAEYNKRRRTELVVERERERG